MNTALSQEQRKRHIEQSKKATLEYLGKDAEPMTPGEKYEAIYQADLKAMGGKLDVSKEEYIASLKASDAGGAVDFSSIGSQPDANTATLSAKPSTGDEKYRKQYRADKALLGSDLTATEEEYIASLKVTESGGVLHLQ